MPVPASPSGMKQGTRSSLFHIASPTLVGEVAREA